MSRLSEASLRISESLDFDTVVQGVLDSARSLTGARYGVMTLLDDEGTVQDFQSLGMSAGEATSMAHAGIPRYMIARSVVPTRTAKIFGRIMSPYEIRNAKRAISPLRHLLHNASPAH